MGDGMQLNCIVTGLRDANFARNALALFAGIVDNRRRPGVEDNRRRAMACLFTITAAEISLSRSHHGEFAAWQAPQLDVPPAVAAPAQAVARPRGGGGG